MMSSRDVLVFRVGLFTRVALLTFPLELIPRILLPSLFFVCVSFLRFCIPSGRAREEC